MTKHVADDQLASFARKTWELQGRLNKGTLDPIEVNKGLQRLIENETEQPETLLNWESVLQIENIEVMKIVVSCFFLDTNFASHYTTKSPAINTLDPRYPFPKSLIDFLIMLDFFSDPLSYGKAGAEEAADFINSPYKIGWGFVIQDLQLPIPILMFGDDPDPVDPPAMSSMPIEILQQLTNLSDLEYSKEFIQINWQDNKYLLIEVITDDFLSIKISPIEYFDLNR